MLRKSPSHPSNLMSLNCSSTKEITCYNILDENNSVLFTVFNSDLIYCISVVILISNITLLSKSTYKVLILQSKLS